MNIQENLQSDDETEVLELPFLLPSWQVVALETAAHRRGMTVAAMMRALLSDFLTEGDRRPGRKNRVLA